MITLDVRALALRLENAYSTDRYRNGWSGCVRMLLKRGYNEAQIEAIIRSKWTRWAADGFCEAVWTGDQRRSRALP